MELEERKVASRRAEYCVALWRMAVVLDHCVVTGTVYWCYVLVQYTGTLKIVLVRLYVHCRGAGALCKYRYTVVVLDHCITTGILQLNSPALSDLTKKTCFVDICDPNIVTQCLVI